jgi:competence protein ComEC
VLLIALSCAWVAGIWLGASLNLPWYLSLAGLVPLSRLFFTRQHRRAIVTASLGLFTLLAAAAYAYPGLHTVDEGSLRFYNDLGTVQIKGMVAGDPDVRDSSTRLELAAAEIRRDGGWHKVAGTALLFVPAYPAYRYGDVLLVTGELKTPSRLGDFDYPGYLAHRGIYTTVSYPRIERLDTGQGSRLLAGIYWLRQRLAQSLSQVLPEPQASLAQAMVLGIRGGIPRSLNDAFARSGTAHLLACESSA